MRQSLNFTPYRSVGPQTYQSDDTILESASKVVLCRHASLSFWALSQATVAGYHECEFDISENTKNDDDI